LYKSQVKRRHFVIPLQAAEQQQRGGGGDEHVRVSAQAEHAHQAHVAEPLLQQGQSYFNLYSW
jgi:hypothetical protein